MKNNPHYYSAQYGELVVDERQIEATLALAYEQHTANLIAHAQLLTPSKELTELVATIKERLGL